ncbi:MAG TPA: hypothetical protein VH723_06675 [Candidatus Limnocylindrales bacterium]|jgi:hypothetical protein
MRLVQAHLDLARAEIGEILDEVKAVIALAGLAIGAVLLAALLLGIGLFLFLGEWIFGSMGWGILHGTLLLTGIAVAAGVAAVDYGARRIAANLLGGVVIGIAVGVVFGLDLTWRGWSALGEAVVPTWAADTRPLITAVVAVGLVFGLLGAFAGRGGGIRGILGGFVGGAIVGALLGAVTAIPLGPRVGAGIGVAVALIAWIALMGMGIARRGVDTDALKKRFTPDETIETTKETIEWVRRRTPLGPAS